MRPQVRAVMGTDPPARGAQAVTGFLRSTVQKAIGVRVTGDPGAAVTEAAAGVAGDDGRDGIACPGGDDGLGDPGRWGARAIGTDPNAARTRSAARPARAHGSKGGEWVSARASGGAAGASEDLSRKGICQPAASRTSRQSVSNRQRRAAVPSGGRTLLPGCLAAGHRRGHCLTAPWAPDPRARARGLQFGFLKGLVIFSVAALLAGAAERAGRGRAVRDVKPSSRERDEENRQQDITFKSARAAGTTGAGRS